MSLQLDIISQNISAFAYIPTNSYFLSLLTLLTCQIDNPMIRPIQSRPNKMVKSSISAYKAHLRCFLGSSYRTKQNGTISDKESSRLDHYLIAFVCCYFILSFDFQNLFYQIFGVRDSFLVFVSDSKSSTDVDVLYLVKQVEKSERKSHGLQDNRLILLFYIGAYVLMETDYMDPILFSDPYRFKYIVFVYAEFALRTSCDYMVRRSGPNLRIYSEIYFLASQFIFVSLKSGQLSDIQDHSGLQSIIQFFFSHEILSIDNFMWPETGIQGFVNLTRRSSINVLNPSILNDLYNRSIGIGLDGIANLYLC